ncbi:MAG: stage 0 sporulation protein [Zetaproteobacteria bacterium]|nr:stage 0 sporulation protein [Pseudobdellovibrionaceae bacterium]
MQGTNIAGVQFKRAGKIYDFIYKNINLRIGDQVVVETQKGLGTGKVVVIGFQDGEQSSQKELKPIIKKVIKDGKNEKKSQDRKLSDEEMSDLAKKKISKHKLKMKILKCESQYGGNRVTVYFSSPGRVDFRDLVKDLASGLKARVELKQVGARDETKLLGGLGVCGREYCCSSFLREFVPVSIKMAKNQNLALNPNKVSGGCGRLLCCLTYENETYKTLRKTLPPIGSLVASRLQNFSGIVQKSDLLNQVVQVKVETSEGNSEIKTLPVAELTMLKKSNN